MNWEALYAPIKYDFERFERRLAACLSQTPKGSLRQVNAYLLRHPGKRLRPFFCLLAHRIEAPDKPLSDEGIELAVAFELLHMASLIHDDIIDHADTRHHQPTVHVKWGQEVGIPMGVYLYTLALGCIAKVGNLEVLRRVSHCVKKLCEGEINQVFERGNIDLDIKRHLVILKHKTALLFSAASATGAIMAGASRFRAYQMQYIGCALGMLFQITDDYLDVFGTDQDLGKSIGQDLLMGDITLPILFLLSELSPSDYAQVSEAVHQKNAKSLEALYMRFKGSQVQTRMRELGVMYKDRVGVLLSGFSPSVYRTHMERLVTVIFDRAF